MCFTSAVFDQWNPYVPTPGQWKFTPGEPTLSPTLALTPPSPSNPYQFTPEQLRVFLDAFHQAVEAARIFDSLTGQPACEDPEKARLEDRVAELERRISELLDD